MSDKDDKDDEVRFNVKMRRQLRDDAKRSTDRGELSEDVRDLFRRKAYGVAGGESTTDLERKKAELRDVRERKEELRRKRRRTDAELESQEEREARLEEQIAALEERDDKFSTVVDTLETMLLDGARIFPERVDDDLDSQRVIDELRDRNPEVPDRAFRLSKPHEPIDWRGE